MRSAIEFGAAVTPARAPESLACLFNHRTFREGAHATNISSRGCRPLFTSVLFRRWTRVSQRVAISALFDHNFRNIRRTKVLRPRASIPPAKAPYLHTLMASPTTVGKLVFLFATTFVAASAVRPISRCSKIASS